MLNFYLSTVDDRFGYPQDNLTIGILLCKSKDRVVVEYALQDVHKPMGVAEYRLAQALPEEPRGSLPTAEELEAELKRVGEDEASKQRVGLWQVSWVLCEARVLRSFI